MVDEALIIKNKPEPLTTSPADVSTDQRRYVGCFFWGVDWRTDLGFSITQHQAALALHPFRPRDVYL